MSRKKLPKLTDAEFEIMKIVWENGEATISHVLESINAQKSNILKRTTIQVQMTRLEEKGWLSHRKEGRSFFYKATRGREKVAAEITKDISNRVFAGSQAEMVKSLFQNEKVSRQELKRIRRILEKYERG
jgi:predicted transcriptional regulator